MKKVLYLGARLRLSLSKAGDVRFIPGFSILLDETLNKLNLWSFLHMIFAVAGATRGPLVLRTLACHLVFFFFKTEMTLTLNTHITLIILY